MEGKTVRLPCCAYKNRGGGLANIPLHILPLPACPEAHTAAAFVPCIPMLPPPASLLSLALPSLHHCRDQSHFAHHQSRASTVILPEPRVSPHHACTSPIQSLPLPEPALLCPWFIYRSPASGLIIFRAFGYQFRAHFSLSQRALVRLA